MSQKNPIIQDIAVIALFSQSGDNPIGEAFRKGFPVPEQPMSPRDRLDMVARLGRGVQALMRIAKRKHLSATLETKEVNSDYITRLSTNEFFFYTQEPLSLNEFQKLQERIATQARNLPSGIQLILSSFAVQNEDGNVMNVTVHLTCGAESESHFIVKNHTSVIDVRYQIPDGKGRTRKLDPLDRSNSPHSMPRIRVNGVSREFTFDSTVRCKTPGGTPFITAIDICVDHHHGIATKSLKKLITEDPNVLSFPVSHVLVSNCFDLIKENCLVPEVMHVDPAQSRKQCKEGVAQDGRCRQTPVFGKDFFDLYYVKPRAIQQLKKAPEEKTVPDEAEQAALTKAALDTTLALMEVDQAAAGPKTDSGKKTERQAELKTSNFAFFGDANKRILKKVNFDNCLDGIGKKADEFYERGHPEHGTKTYMIWMKLVQIKKDFEKNKMTPQEFREQALQCMEITDPKLLAFLSKDEEFMSWKQQLIDAVLQIPESSHEHFTNF